jgi:hypothetical protein
VSSSTVTPQAQRTRERASGRADAHRPPPAVQAARGAGRDGRPRASALLERVGLAVRENLRLGLIAGREIQGRYCAV